MRLSILTLAAAALILVSACTNDEPAPRIGYIKLSSLEGTNMSFGYAVFIPRPPLQKSCTRTTIGACDVLECVDVENLPPPANESAGTITVDGTTLDGGFVLTFGNVGCLQNNCPAYKSPEGLVPPLWKGGETLTASAAGDRVPGFSGKTVTAPSEIRVTAPACLNEVFGSTRCAVSNTTDLTIEWTGSASTTMEAMFNTTNSKHRFVSAICRFASSPSTISAEVMAKMQKTDAGSFGYLSVRGANESTFTVGEYDVTLRAENWGVGNWVDIAD